MEFRPCFHEALLTLRKQTGDERDRRNGKNGDVLAMVSMKMRNVMPRGWLHKHADDDAKET